MRRFFLIAYCVLISISAFSNSYWIKDLESQRIPDENVVNMFNQWFNINNQSTFEKTRDYTDNLGIRHQNFKQFYNGLPVEGYLIIVHSKNGTVSAVNGYVMEDVVNTSTLRKSSEGELVVVPVSSNEEIVYHTAYKTIDTKRMVEVYTDATTGTVIKEISLVNNYDVSGTAQTLYNGVQNITCDYVESQGLYRLVDNKRKIYTLNASVVNGEELENNAEQWRQNNPDYDNDNMLEQYVKLLTEQCEYIAVGAPEFYRNAIGLQITISKVDDNWWNKKFSDSKPDLYIKLLDKNNNLIYKTPTKSDASLPVTFNISKTYIPAPLEELYFQVCEEDSFSDDMGSYILIKPTASSKEIWQDGDKPNSQGYYQESSSILGANDIHWGMEEIFDFYKIKFNRISYDDNGGWIIQYLYPPVVNDNFNAQASHIQPYVIFYGIGGELKNYYLTKPYVVFDILAHEFTHLVTAHNGQGGLEYSSESGALNESFSDIMACVAEKYVFGNTANWNIGDNLFFDKPYMRSMESPKIGYDILPKNVNGVIVPYIGLKPQPDTYKGEYWADTSDLSPTGDQGGVHTNSGVQNKWFYLLSEGGSGSNDKGDNYTVKGIGIDMAAQIAYRDLVTYLTPTATFYNSREGSIAAAKDLYGVSSQAYKSVMDAWHAVGVGDDYNNTITSVISNLPDEQFPITIKYMTNGKIFVKKGNDVYDMLGKKVK